MKHTLTKFKHYLLTICILATLSTANACNKESNSLAIQASSISINNHSIVYDSIAKNKNIILLHGLFGSKSQWSSFGNLLAKHGYHVIILDLPGYGKSTDFPEEDYAIEKQVELLDQFVTKLHINQFAIAGNSMGGLIAAEYAKKYPEKITSLAFIGSPLGITTPKLSKTQTLLNRGENPFIPITEEQFHREMALLFTTPPKLENEQIKKRVAQYRKEEEKDLRIWNTVQKSSVLLNKPTDISIPTLIIWGDNDHVFDVSGADILKNNIKSSELIIIKNGSHIPFIEDPKLIAKYYLGFLKSKNKPGQTNANQS